VREQRQNAVRVSVAEWILYLLHSVMFVKLFEDGDIFVCSWMRLWEIEIKCLMYLGLLYCFIIIWWWMYCMCQMAVISGCCWLCAAFCSCECCSSVINTPAYSGDPPFLSLFFSLSLSFLNWLGEYQEPNLSHPLATAFPISRIMQHYCLCVLPVLKLRWYGHFNFTSVSFGLEFGEISCFRPCKW
jgi:hypothetical protein